MGAVKRSKKKVGMFYLDVDRHAKNTAELVFEIPGEFRFTATGSDLTQIVENLASVSSELLAGIVSERKRFEWRYL